MIDRQTVEDGFRERIKILACPECGLEFTDYAVDWGWAWSEGRLDLLKEMGMADTERDGPFKIRCELCGQRCWYNYFSGTVSRVEG